MSLLVSNPDGLPLVERPGESVRQFSFTVTPQPGEGIGDLCHRLARQWLEQDAAPLHLLGFGHVRARAAATAALQKFYGRVDWPVTWVEGAACDGGPIAGMQVHAFTGAVERVTFGGRIVGSVFTEGGAQQCFVGGLSPNDKTLSRAEQTRQTLEDLQKILAAHP